MRGDPPYTVCVCVLQAQRYEGYPPYTVCVCVLQAQRYEGGSTIYGPHTLEAYVNVYMNLSNAMIKVRSIYINITHKEPVFDKNKLNSYRFILFTCNSIFTL